MGLHGSRQGEKERQCNEMDFSFLFLIHFIMSCFIGLDTVSI